jgi:hypothetical protein
MKLTGRWVLVTQNYEIPEKALKAVPKPEPLAETFAQDQAKEKEVVRTGNYEEKMELQATQKKIRPPSNSRWTQNDHYFEENHEQSDRPKPQALPLDRDPNRSSNKKQPTWETDADDYHERAKAKQSETFSQAQRTQPAYPTRADMKSRNLRDMTPPRPDSRTEPQQQIDPITNLPKPSRLVAGNHLKSYSNSKSQQGPRAARETFKSGEQSQGTDDKKYPRLTRPELSHYGERFLPPLLPAPSSGPQSSASKPSHYQREMSTLE